VSVFDHNDDDWFEISGIFELLGQRKPSKRFKLCADASVPCEFIGEVKQTGIPIETTFEAGLATHAAPRILAWARRSSP